MQRLFSFVLFVIVLAVIIHYGLRDDEEDAVVKAPPPEALAPVGATLLAGLDGYPFPITHHDAEVQRWFNQGLALTYGFNHGAAERSFLKATALEPDCAMCWWGAALVLGPHLNAPMEPADAGKAWNRLQKAKSLAAKASPKEQAYIEALSARYAETPPEDRQPLDSAYAEALAELVQKYPDDLDAATFRAEALMDLQPWDFYDQDQNPIGRTEEFVAILESVIERNPEHPGALHLYIHAVEASTDPDRGAAAADRLRTLLPGAGHLVHMPAHIYTRVGRYHDATLANQNAIKADDAYLAACRPPPGVYPLGYVPHNHHFLWWAAAMAGESAQALAAAAETRKRIANPELLASPGLEFLHDFWSTPLKAQVQFGQWDEILATPKPSENMPYAVGIWEYAQGMAAVRQGRLDAGRAHLDALAAATKNPAIAQIHVGPQHTLDRTLIVAERILAGELRFARGDTDSAINAFEQAVQEEDANIYTEPPLWYQPARQYLGSALLRAELPAAAETVFRADLARNRANGWSLFGLVESLKAQEKPFEQADQAFNDAWQHADIDLSGPVF